MIYLDSYFESKRALFYFDVLMKNESVKKEDFLKKLNISYSSYKRAKEDETKTGKNILKVLLKYYHLNPLDINKKREYEKLLNDIWYTFYYRGSNLNSYKEKLLSYMNDLTILNPIFKLFLLLIEITTDKNLSYTRSFIADYALVKQYAKSYFIFPFKDIFMVLDSLYDLKNEDKIFFESKDIEFNNMIEYSHVTNLFMHKKYELALYFASNLSKKMLEGLNIKRYVILNLTICTILNIIGEYKKSIEISKKQIDYLKYQSDHEFLDLTEFHYYISLIGLKEYNQVILRYQDDYETNYAYIFLLICYHNINLALYKELIKRYEKNKEEVTPLFRDLINLVIAYYQNKKEYAIKIQLSELNEALKVILLNER